MRPFVHVNFAITLDGCLGGPGRTPLRISNGEDQRRVHELRASVDAILVGVGTVVADDPKLTVKWDLLGRTGTHPLRVVLDPSLRTPPSAEVLSAAAKTVFFSGPKAPDRPGWDIERVKATRGALDLAEVLAKLSKRGVKRLMVEGGPNTLVRFFEADLVDALTFFIAPRIVGAPDAPRLHDAALNLGEFLKLEKADVLGDGVVLSWTRAR